MKSFGGFVASDGKTYRDLDGAVEAVVALGVELPPFDLVVLAIFKNGQGEDQNKMVFSTPITWICNDSSKL